MTLIENIVNLPAKMFIFCGLVALGITVCIIEKLDGTDKKAEKDDFPD